MTPEPKVKAITKLTPLELYAVRVPKDAVCHIIPMEMIYRDSKNEDNWAHIALPSSNWEIVGEVTKDSISFDPKPFVDYIDFENREIYRDYLIKEEGCFGLFKPQESFYSLLAANGVHFENPMGKKPKEEYYHAGQPDDLFACPDYDIFYKDLAEWQSYESNLVDKVIILKQV